MASPGPRTTCRYSKEFKATAVRLSQLEGVSIKDVAESLAIHPFMLSFWRKQAHEGLIVTKGIAVDKEVAAELKRTVRHRKRMAPSFESLAGLSVSHVWFGDYLALYLELGELRPRKRRKDGSTGNLQGQITVYAGYNWRLERAASIHCGRASTHLIRQKAAVGIRGSTVTAASTAGRIPELEIGFSNRLWLTTFVESKGQPEWSVSFNNSKPEHLCVARGRLHVDRRG